MTTAKKKKAAPAPEAPPAQTVETVTQSMELTIVQTALTTMSRVDAGIAELATKYKDVLFDVTTEEGMAAAKAARKAIATPRIELEKIRATAKKPILELGRKLDKEATRIEAELLQLEKPIDEQIKAEEQRIEAEKAEAARIEAERTGAIMSRIAEIRGAIAMGAKCVNSDQLARHIEDLNAMLTGESFDATFQEFGDVAREALNESIDSLHEMRKAALQREEQQKAIDAQQAEIDKQRAEQAERDRKREETEAAERARKARIQDYIAELRGNQTLTASSGAALIAEHIFDLDNMVIGEDLGEFQQQARDAKSAGLSRLNSLRLAAIAHETEQERLRVQREEQEAAQREADRKAGIQRRIASISEAVLRATECTLSVEVVRIVAEVEAMAVDEGFGEFREQADAVKKRALERLRSYQKALEAGEEIVRQTQARAAADAKAAREKEEAERAEQERIAREAEAERQANFRPTLDALVRLVAGNFDCELETARAWIIQAVADDFDASEKVAAGL